MNAVFQQLECRYAALCTHSSISWNFEEGAYLSAKDNLPGTPEGKVKVAVAHVSGPVRRILLGERVALNTLARCAGIATAYVHV